MQLAVNFQRPHAAPFVRKIISDSGDYIQNIVKVDPKYHDVVDECINNHPSCSEWAMGTGCDDNPKCKCIPFGDLWRGQQNGCHTIYTSRHTSFLSLFISLHIYVLFLSDMKMECSPACQSCDYILEKKLECALKEGTEDDAIQVGGMDALFERMVRLADENNWQPTVLSRPAKKAIDEDGSSTPVLPCEDDVTNPCNTHDGPWVITLENFISDEEIQVLLDWGAKIGYERSQAGDEVVEARTSSHAWCTIEEGCYDDPIVKSLRKRIAFVTGVPEENYECLQLLKYVEGTYYKPHNDFIVKHAEQKHGPRLLTFFIYFNEVTKGGGTRFPRINWPQGLTVEPKPGRVLIWPSCLDHDLYKEDKRTEHEAMKVVEGEKFSANAWSK